MIEARVHPARNESTDPDRVPPVAEPVCGNPFARRTAALRQALVNAVSEQDIAEIARAMVEKARGGDTAAARLVLSYTMGKPAARPDPDTLDRQELTNLARNHVGVKEANRMAQRIPADVMLNFFRPLLPILAEVKAQQMVKDWHTAAAEHDEMLKEAKEDKEQSAAQARCEQGTPAPQTSAGDEDLRETLRIWERETEDVKKELGIETGGGRETVDAQASAEVRRENCRGDPPLPPTRNRLDGPNNGRHVTAPIEE